MARKKPTHHTTKKNHMSEEFPTIFFESTTASAADSNDKKNQPAESLQPKNQKNNSYTERLIWMWSGVAIVMIVILLTWTKFLNASGILDLTSWTKNDSLIQTSRESLKYYFEKQNKDRAELDAITQKSLQITSSSTPPSTLSADQINQLKQKILTQQINSSSTLPSLPNKK